MPSYQLSPDGSTVYRIVPQGNVAASTLNASLLTAYGYTVATENVGTLTTSVYEAGWRGYGGGHFEAVYSHGTPLGSGESLQWVQVITTSAPLGGATSPYLDNRLNATTMAQPFYALTRENSASGPAVGPDSIYFYDFSTRPPLTGTTSSINWSAALYPVIVKGQTITVENGVTWGWEAKKATVGSVSGVFTSPSPSSATVGGVGTSNFTWGIGNPDVSSLSFVASSFDTTPGTRFKLGTLTYHNGTIVGDSGASSVNFSASINLANVPELNTTLNTMFQLINSVNTDDPIASADKVSIGSFGYTFNVLEGATATVDIYATLTGSGGAAPSGVGFDSAWQSGTFGQNYGFTLSIVGIGNASDGGFVQIYGDGLANDLTGSEGMEILQGLGGNDRLTALGDDDTLDGGTGADTMIGGKGDDRYLVDDSGDVVVEKADEGFDSVESSVNFNMSANVERLYLTGTTAIIGVGNALANQIYGNAAANWLLGQGGNDRIDGGLGNDMMIGGTGDDSYVVVESGDMVIEEADAGTDTVEAWNSHTLTDNVENLVLMGTAANGTGNALINRVTGNGAANRLDGGAGADRMEGGAGNDTYVVDNSGDRVIEAAGQGADTVLASITWELGLDVENLTLTGTGDINGGGNSLANLIIGNSGANWLVGGAGGDVIDGGTGADRMEGGKDDDDYYVDNAGDRVIEKAGEGNDYVSSTVNFELGANLEVLILLGSANLAGAGNTLDNLLIGNSGNNWLVGGAGLDVLDGRLGADRMEGGTGDDSYYVDNAGDRVVEKANEGNDLVLASVSIELSDNVERATLQGGDGLSAAGNAFANTLFGNTGNNWLVGLGGNDTLDGWLGADRMDGGTGDDTYYVDNAGDKVNEKAGEGIDSVRSAVSFELGANVENLVLTGSGDTSGAGNALANAITGNSGANWLVGSAGDDMINGGTGADRMEGGQDNDSYTVDDSGDRVIEKAGEGTDLVYASVAFELGANVENLTLTGIANISGAGNDMANAIVGNIGDNWLVGGAGNDLIDGGAGADKIDGGTGADTFSFSATIPTGVDFIRDFVVVDDTIQLDQTIFAGITATGTLAAGAFRLGNAALDADDRVLYDAATGYLWYDMDGVGGTGAQLFAKLPTGLAMTSLDFYVVP